MITKIYIVWEGRYNPTIDTIWQKEDDAEKRKNGTLTRHRMDGCNRGDDYTRVESRDVL
jgi:hypothetical protein